MLINFDETLMSGPGVLPGDILRVYYIEWITKSGFRAGAVLSRFQAGAVLHRVDSTQELHTYQYQAPPLTGYFSWRHSLSVVTALYC